MEQIKETNKKRPTVSVIIPAYNAELSLGKCLESVIRQSLYPFEIFVVNDGSTDNTKDVALAFKYKIIYLEQDNQGQGAARNAGLIKAKGKYIAFLDADDYWLPNFLRNCINFLKVNQDAIAVNTGFIINKFNHEDTGPDNIEELAERNPDGFILDNFFEFWAKHDHVRTGAVVIRRDIIEKAGYQRDDLRISQDLEYWGYIATFGKWGFIPKPLWVGNSRAIGRKSGWRAKYRKRRKLCPSVEAWQERILTRLQPDEYPWFEIVRGRVAAGYAHNKILADNWHDARQIVHQYGEAMPSTTIVKLMRLGAKCGPIGWWIICIIITLKEYSKAI